MKALACLLFVGLFACQTKPQKAVLAQSVPGPANPVVPVDPSGNYPAAITTTGGGGYVTIDGGTVTTSAGSVTTLQDSGVTVLNTVVSDTTGADLALNSRTFNAAVATQGILIDAGTHQLIALRGQGEGAATQYLQVYCGQTTTDAGGTNTAGTAPDYQIKCAPGPCDWSMPSGKTCGTGATYYWSTDAGFLSSSLGTGGSGIEAVWR